MGGKVIDIRNAKQIIWKETYLIKTFIMNIYESNNSSSFYNMSWISFAVATIGMIIGILYIEADLAIKGFLAMGYLFTITSCFTLAKVIRDRHESERFLTKMEKAKTEKFMAENVV